MSRAENRLRSTMYNDANNFFFLCCLNKAIGAYHIRLVIDDIFKP